MTITELRKALVGQDGRTEVVIICARCEDDDDGEGNVPVGRAVHAAMTTVTRSADDKEQAVFCLYGS